MKKGMVLGKFMPLHKGHVALINFAAGQCDVLTILVCSTASEIIDGKTRYEWAKSIFGNRPGLKVIHLDYDENELPSSSESSKDISLVWANFLSGKFPGINIIFSSEPYGDFLSEFMNIEHVSFDVNRNTIPISGTEIRNHPFRHWDYLPEEVKPFFVKKICIYGTESTGKSTLAKKLSDYFNTTYVPEMARDIIETTAEVLPVHLLQIAGLHADTISSKIKTANKLLFIDTDVNITRSYSRYLFRKTLEVSDKIEQQNKMDFYFFMSPEAPFVQDGTRLDIDKRMELHLSHKKELDSRNIPYIPINGKNWEHRFRNIIHYIEKNILEAV